MEAIFGRDDWIAKNGISVNSDGSTNNLADFFVYTRDSWIKSMPKIYVANLIWGILCGVILYYITFYSCTGIISKQGYVNDYWNTGVVIFFTLIATHHVLVWTETRNHTAYTSAWYIGCIILFYLAISGSDKLVTSSYYKNQFSMVLGSPLTWLTIIIQTFILVMPRYLWRTFDGIVFHPEFTKIKAD